MSSDGTPIAKIGVIGTGLLGASLIDFLAFRRPDLELVCCEKSPEYRADIERRFPNVRFVDATHELNEADIVFVATPPQTIAPIVKDMLEHSDSGATLVDLASTKKGIQNALRDTAKNLHRYLGGHPLAGGNTRGPDEADKSIFVGSTFLLTPSDATDLRRVDETHQFLTSLDLRVLALDATRHDQVLAFTSHLPHVLAYAYAKSLQDFEARDDDLRLTDFASKSTLQMSHFASPNYEMWTQIFNENQDLSHAIDSFILCMMEIRANIHPDRTHRLNDMLQQYGDYGHQLKASAKQ